MNITCRPFEPGDETVLTEMLYLAVFVPPGAEPLSRAALAEPDLARYVSGWGRAGDDGVVAVASTGEVVGAAWLRLWSTDDRGYGFIDRETPELSMAVRPEYRGRGVGTALLRLLLERADWRYRFVSLSVSRHNPAIRLYHRFGFVPVLADESSTTMRRLGGSWPRP